MVLAVAGGAGAKVIYVDDDARPGGDGASWAAAYTYLQDALADANGAEKPVEIRVAQGTYRPDEGANQKLGDRSATFRLINAVRIKGGYAGVAEPDPNTRATGLYETILSAHIPVEDVQGWASGSPNSYHVVTSSGTDRTAILDGFTITGGIATGLSAGDPADADFKQICGGGLYNESGSPTLVDCIFTGNDAFCGGGMYNVEGSPTLTDCTFRANTAGISGAMHNNRGRPSLRRCVFSANSALWIGAMSNAKCVATVQQCVFTGNRARRAGAIFNSESTVTFINCTFSANRAERDGALCFAEQSSGLLANCVLWHNEGEISDSNESAVDVTYSNVRGGWPGEGNIDADPCFVHPGHWDANGTPDDPNDDFFVEGDYHLRSRAGRWEPVSASWVKDDVTSPCIDAGDPGSAVAFEPYPNGGLVNMGAYGGTAEASKSPSGLHARYGGGSGTADDPYLIYTAEHLSTVGASVADWNAHFRLMADVDLGSYPADGFNLIGRYDEDEPFTGTFDGNGHTIANFRYAGPETNGVGLFGYVTRDTAEIANLTLASPSVDGGAGEFCGSLVGYLGRGTIRNCRVEGAVVAGGRNVGSLVGYNWAGTMAGCSAAGRVAGSQNVGGLLGGNRTGTVSECCAAVAVSGQDDVGGLVGDTSGGAILRCYAAGTVSGSGADIGGLVADNAGILRDCYSRATVEAAPYSESVGGLVGENTGEGTIDNCYTTGRVTAGTGARDVGGLVGANDGTVRHCFWDTQATGQTTSAGGAAAKTTAEMQAPETFLDAGWDFVDETDNGADDVWYLLESDYPRLASELLTELP
ncbi:MAG: hypothetical protein JW741_14415 [Sedimentisphaerales bacterium]|nr:hypothetical protein [Sedimentisphaerales bacterium]